MEILETIIENENTKEEIKQRVENSGVATAIYDAPIEKIENRFVTLKREKGADDAEQEERRIQMRLRERRILEMEMEMKKKEQWEKEEKKEDIYQKFIKL